MSSGFFKKGHVGDFVLEHIQLLKHQDHVFYQEPCTDNITNVGSDIVCLDYKEHNKAPIVLTKKMKRERFAKELNDWSDGPIVDTYGVVRNGGKPIRIRNVLKAMYDDILEAVDGCDEPFEFIDEKQFKEELIYFMYILSDIQR